MFPPCFCLLAVVSLNDSEELSSPVSEEEEEEDDDAESDQAEEDEEQEDSGSEVEIIEEVQGNGKLPPFQPTSIFVQQGHTHFLPSVLEQEAHFSLITPGAEMKVSGLSPLTWLFWFLLTVDQQNETSDEVENLEVVYTF